MESDAIENTDKSDIEVEGNDKKDNFLSEKITKFFLSHLNILESNASNKKEDIKDLKRNFHNLQLLINNLSEDIKEYFKEKENKEVKEKEPVIKHSKSEINNKIAKQPIPNKEVKKPEVNVKSKTPVKQISKPDNRSKTPIQERNKASKLDNKTPIRERPARETNKTPINNKISKSPIPIKSKNELKINPTINIKTIDKKEKKIDEKPAIKKEISSVNKHKNEINEKKLLKNDEKSSVTSEKTEDSTVQKPQETKQPESIIAQEKSVRLNYPKKNSHPEDALINNLESNFVKGLLLTLRSSFLPLKMISNFIFNIKILNPSFQFLKQMMLKLIIQEKEIRNKQLIELLKKYENDTNIEGLSNKTFSASKTAINSLNFIQKEEEINLLKTGHSDQVLTIFKLLFIMLGEEYQSIPLDKLPEKLYNELFPKYKVDSLKTLILNVILKNLDFSKAQIEAMIKIIEENQKLLVSSELLKLNKVVSYTTFILKEIYEYQTAKFPDGEYIYMIREERRNQVELLQKIEELKKIV